MAAWSSPPVTVYVTETGFSAEDQTLLGSANAFANTSPWYDGAICHRRPVERSSDFDTGAQIRFFETVADDLI